MNNLTTTDNLAIATAAKMVRLNPSTIKFFAAGTKYHAAGSYVIRRREVDATLPAHAAQDPWVIERLDGAAYYSVAPTLDCAVRISIRHLGAVVATFATT